ncbi:MAG: tetratricopeptide repeat protein [Phycisphaerales bacterium JB064]
MSTDQSAGTADTKPATGQDPAVAPWREIWQIPTFGVAAAALVIGLAVTLLFRPTPDYTSLLDGAEKRIEARRYVEALDVLNGKLSPLLERPTFTPELKRRFYTLRARAISMGQTELGVRQPANDRNIVTEYREAERQGAALSPQDVFFLAQAYIGLEEIGAALSRADAMPATERPKRHELYRLAILQTDIDTPGGQEQLIDLVNRFVTDPTLGVNERAWAELQRAKVLAATGDYTGVVDRLLRTYPQWAKAGEATRAALSVELGTAHMELGDLESARVALELAEQMAESQSAERGQAIVLLGRIDELSGQPQEARDRYAKVLRELGWSPAAQAARLGLAEVYAAEGEHELALDVFQEALAEFRENGPGAGVTGEVLESALLLQYENQSAAGLPADALRYARMAERTHDGERSPLLTLALAEANRAVAEAMIRDAGGDEDGAPDALHLDATTREEVRTHLRAAGGYYALHADLVTLDESAFERSTWLSAVCFDRAGDLELAEQKLTTFVTAISESPMRAEARYRLGRIYQAKSRHSAAEEAFRGLIDDANDSDTGKGVGPFALMSYVPLAQTLLADADTENDVEARVLLERVLSGGLVGPTSEEYRTALVELGNLHYRSGEYVSAIERLREALARYEGERQEQQIRFRLADAYRLEATRIATALEQAMPGSERRELQRIREERLRTAIEQYELARAGLEKFRDLSAIEREALRNAYFFLGSCAYDLQDYELAVKHYAAAHAKYSGDPSALVPLIQIVSARLQQGEIALARAANERAQRLYESFPDEVWADANLPLTRDDWQRWFQASERLATAGG